MYKRAQLGIGYLAQEASVFRKLSVEDNIKSILEMTKLTKQQQQEKLDKQQSEIEALKAIVCAGNGAAEICREKKP